MVKFLKSILFKIYQVAFTIMGILLPKDKKMIVFESFLGKQYSDNPRAIYEYIQQKYPEYDLYWSAEGKSLEKFEGHDVQILRRFSFRWMMKMNRAKYWVSNSRLPLWIPKPKQTIYVQTWHGTPLKRLAADMDEVHMPGTHTEQYKRNFLAESSKWDYLISPNSYSTEIFQRAFQFNKTMLETGYPRNDYLITANEPKEIERLKKQIGLPLDKKIILYAPTWRDNQFYGRGRYKFELQLELDKMRENFGDEYIILLRMHYLVAEHLNIEEYKEFVYDLSLHEDIRELYLISDVLITDYSSVFFDYANLKRPILFYVYDIEEYRDTLRGFYVDFEKEAPGPLVKTTDALIEQIKQLEHMQRTYREKYDQFYEKYCDLEDGNASARVVESILKE